MRRMILPCLMVAWLVCPRIAAAQEPDPIKRALDQARSDHGRRRDAAKVKLSQDIEATIKAAADKSDLPGLKQLEAQKEAFDRDGQLPTGAMVAKARLTY
ncbi:MAG: hypothetical protein JWN86_3349, partial [Planctomycetota bacterium]|nr:hypothetical protein [Planctomycetota bacterium]